MKVKIGNTIYDSEYEPIMLIFNDGDRDNIANMDKDATKYCTYPDNEDYDSSRIKKFMKTN